jgi:hypothetical protein
LLTLQDTGRRNFNGVIVDARAIEANGTAERPAALDMIDDNAGPGPQIVLPEDQDRSHPISAPAAVVSYLDEFIFAD